MNRNTSAQQIHQAEAWMENIKLRRKWKGATNLPSHQKSNAFENLTTNLLGVRILNDFLIWRTQSSLRNRFRLYTLDGTTKEKWFCRRKTASAVITGCNYKGLILLCCHTFKSFVRLYYSWFKISEITVKAVFLTNRPFDSNYLAIKNENNS